MSHKSEDASSYGKAVWVRSMFARIAPKYDLLNHALSLNIDRRWRRFASQKVAEAAPSSGARFLDLCCGTGDLSLELNALGPTCGVDFCRPMLALAKEKARRFGRPIALVEADALHVPFLDELFDAVAIGFGLRNLESIEEGLVEIRRLLRPGGLAAILEFSHPTTPVFKTIFSVYFSRVLPFLGNAVSGSRFAYRYLPDSVERFPDQESLAGMMRAVGFSNVRYYNLSGGVAALHLGEKPSGPA